MELLIKMVGGKITKSSTSTMRLSLHNKRKLIIQRHKKKEKRNQRILKGELTKNNDKKLLIKTKKFIKQEQQKRLKKMRKEIKDYSLKELDQTKIRVQFKILDTKHNKINKINFKTNGIVNCTCFDWRIRCKKYNISCKHILFILEHILKIKINSVKKNIFKFNSLFQRSLCSAKRTYFKKQKFEFLVSNPIDSSILCAICFSNFPTLKDSLKCPKCSNFVHETCMKNWLVQADHKRCLFCRDSVWKKFYKAIKNNKD
jgi:hypothetical protein